MSCGGPTRLAFPLPTGVRGPESFAVPGDVTTTVVQPTVNQPGILVGATGSDPVLVLLGRFHITLSATDPRSGRETFGTAVPLGPGAGYFSLPDFTGDASFPEIMIKMVSAIDVPSMGGTFWFFHDPLTDIPYNLTVIDS